MKTRLPFIAAALVLALLFAWWLGLFGSVKSESMPPAAPAPTPKVANASVASPASGSAPAIPVKAASPMAVVAPILPPAKVSAANPGKGTASAATVYPPPSDDQIKSIKNNLRQLSGAAHQYMLDHGVSEASYYDFVGSSINDLLRNVNAVDGEDYTGVVIDQSTTQVTVSTPDGTTVTFNE
jgi:hypothetical protein